MKSKKKFRPVGFTILMLAFWAFFIWLEVFDPTSFKNAPLRPLAFPMIFLTPILYLLGMFNELVFRPTKTKPHNEP